MLLGPITTVQVGYRCTQWFCEVLSTRVPLCRGTRTQIENLYEFKEHFLSPLSTFVVYADLRTCAICI